MKTLALSIEEAAEAVRLGRTRLYEEIRTGRLIARKCGRRTIILETDLLAYLSNLPKAK